jgi:spermidine/putrescine transport system substrate-binding protein
VSIKPIRVMLAAALLGAMAAGGGAAAETLRIRTWVRVPDDIIRQFRRETGVDVRLMATIEEPLTPRPGGRPGVDLFQLSPNDPAGPKRIVGAYKPLDLSRIRTDLFIPSLWEATRRKMTFGGKVYGVPAYWETDGLVVNVEAAPKLADYPGLCDPGLAGRTALSDGSAMLAAFAFSGGMDPFAAYGDPGAYAAIMDRVGAGLAPCKRIVKRFTVLHEIPDALRSGAIVAAMVGQDLGLGLAAENASFKFIVPKSTSPGWIHTYVIPRGSRKDEAAYRWINFTMRPEIAGRIASVSLLPASSGFDAFMDSRLKRVFAESFPDGVIDGIRWSPDRPEGIHDINVRLLDLLDEIR